MSTRVTAVVKRRHVPWYWWIFAAILGSSAAFIFVTLKPEWRYTCAHCDEDLIVDYEHCPRCRSYLRWLGV